MWLEYFLWKSRKVKNSLILVCVCTSWLRDVSGNRLKRADQTVNMKTQQKKPKAVAAAREYRSVFTEVHVLVLEGRKIHDINRDTVHPARLSCCSSFELAVHSSYLHSTSASNILVERCMNFISLKYQLDPVWSLTFPICSKFCSRWYFCILRYFKVLRLIEHQIHAHAWWPPTITFLPLFLSPFLSLFCCLTAMNSREPKE